MLKISKRNHISYKDIREKSKIIDVSEHANKMKWFWAGHLQRFEDNRCAKQSELWIPEGRKRRGLRSGSKKSKISPAFSGEEKP